MDKFVIQLKGRANKGQILTTLAYGKIKILKALPRDNWDKVKGIYKYEVVKIETNPGWIPVKEGQIMSPTIDDSNVNEVPVTESVLPIINASPRPIGFQIAGTAYFVDILHQLDNIGVIYQDDNGRYRKVLVEAYKLGRHIGSIPMWENIGLDGERDDNAA